VGRFAHVEAPQDLQYAAAHRNSPGKYFIELPCTLAWTLLSWLPLGTLGTTHTDDEQQRPVRFRAGRFGPSLGVSSVRRRARNIYLARSGLALLLGWWVEMSLGPRPVDRRPAWEILLLLFAVPGRRGRRGPHRTRFLDDARPLRVSLPLFRWAGERRRVRDFGMARRGAGLMLRGLFSCCWRYCALLVAPASQI